MILHICVLDKFIAPFYEFIETHFEDFNARHFFYVIGKGSVYRAPQGRNTYLAQEHTLTQRYAWLIRNMNRADKIILHGLWDFRVLQLLTTQPWLLKKCYWVIWGGDLYSYQLGKRTLGWWKVELFRRFVIKRIGHFITHIKGDYKLAKKWYGAKGEWHECFMYPSNLYQELPIQSLPHEGVNILVGNSADPTNNHIEVLDKLKYYSKDNIRIYCPLSYGDQSYALKISNYGAALFGDKFIALRDFMPLAQYYELLAKIDVAIFNHRRQQGMGNITTLLGMGKKVYLRKEITTCEFLRKLGVAFFDINSICLSKIEKDIENENTKVIRSCFSTGNLINQLKGIFQ